MKRQLIDDFDKLMEYQNILQNNLLKEAQVDKKLELLTIINQLTAGPKNIVQKEMIIIEATQRGLSEAEIDKQIEQLKK